jgi:hypothetical protein
MIKDFLKFHLKKTASIDLYIPAIRIRNISVICRGILKPRQALPSSRELVQSLAEERNLNFMIF